MTALLWTSLTCTVACPGPTIECESNADCADDEVCATNEAGDSRRCVPDNRDPVEVDGGGDGDGDGDDDGDAGTSVPPTIDAFAAAPTEFFVANGVELSWTTTDAVSCAVTSNETIPMEPYDVPTASVASGTVNVSPNEATTYTLACVSASDGEAESSTSVSPRGAQSIDSFVVDGAASSTRNVGANIELSWTATNALLCAMEDVATGDIVVLDGQRETGTAMRPVTVDQDWRLLCEGNGPQASSTVNVIAARIASLTATPMSITSGDDVTFAWTLENAVADGCVLSDGGANSSTEASPVTLAVTTSSTFTLTCPGVSGDPALTAAVDVTVQ